MWSDECGTQFRNKWDGETGGFAETHLLRIEGMELVIQIPLPTYGISFSS